MKFTYSFGLLISASLLISQPSLAQTKSEKCASHTHWVEKVQKDPSLAIQREKGELRIQEWIKNNGGNKASFITIPVVFHVLYNESQQNISDAQIMSQLDILNEDFQLQNSDSLTPSSAFWVDAANTQIEFCLAKRDPDGNATSGITRTFTDTVVFNGSNKSMFSPSTGGVENWDPTKYLNFYIVDLNGDLLGFAQFPDELTTDPETDGVVVRHQAVGNIGTAGTEGWTGNDLGRTATHEVGHWLGLWHIWGDAQCGDDLVSDTPEHEQDNSGCPTEPHNANNVCGTGSDGEMFMNYMDYPDDACLVMFTFGQRDRMHAQINTYRSDLLTSNGCMEVGNEEYSLDARISIYPNPVQQTLNVSLYDIQLNQIRIQNLSGQVVFEQNGLQDEIGFKIDVDDLESGMYLMQLLDVSGQIHSRKIMVQ